MRVACVDGMLVFSGALAPGDVAYVDGDQLPRAPEGEVSPVVLAAGADVAARDGRALAALAGTILAAVTPETSVRVLGAGAVAHVLRRRLTARSRGTERPGLIVDLTGDPESIRESLRAVADLGTVVLAGRAMPSSLDLDAYPDLHVRGLRLVGVPVAVEASGRLPVVTGDESPGPPVEAHLGIPVRPGAPWYRITA